MKQSSKTALGGIVSALSVVLMLMTAVIPFMSYALPLIAGALLILMVIEINKSWAFIVYAAVSLLAVFVVPDKEAAVFYVAFFGYYPIIKSTLEKHLPRVVEWIVKFAIFNAAVIAAYFFTVKVLGIPFDDMGEWGKYGIFILLAVANVTFLVYDIMLTKLVTLYLYKFRKSFKKIFK
ncbi:MAG: hypothetical protein IJA02_03490 [Clostridia bacterium]|nr:hypothetical protein [Clostridia bacterium]MBR6619128.1 hypothetical protein [Clostridia bacterium]